MWTYVLWRVVVHQVYICGTKDVQDVQRGKAVHVVQTYISGMGYMDTVYEGMSSSGMCVEGYQL